MHASARKRVKLIKRIFQLLAEDGTRKKIVRCLEIIGSRCDFLKMVKAFFYNFSSVFLRDAISFIVSLVGVNLSRKFKQIILHMI